jgi:CubicO group peptidase (beta-lactamase class C family)
MKMHRYIAAILVFGLAQFSWSSPIMVKTPTMEKDKQTLQYGSPSSAGMDDRVNELIDQVVEASLAARETSGAVVLVARRGVIVHEKAYGYRSIIPTQEKMTTDTIFDLASVTKCVATASAVLKLVELGKVRLNDPVYQYIAEWKNAPEDKKTLEDIDKLRRFVRQGLVKIEPGFTVSENTSTSAIALLKSAKEKPTELWKRLWSQGDLRLAEKFFDDYVAARTYDREAVTLKHLLTHTSGLDAYDNYYLKFPARHARQAIVQNIAQRPLRAPAGKQFIYSDLGYITLGEIVERVSGMSLDAFCRKFLYEPLGMKDTMFNPPPDLHPRVAPSEWRVPPAGAKDAAVKQKYMIRGEVHDGNAFVQDGVSGHAGLFSTAHDLAVFVQMLLQGGSYGNARVFSPLTVRGMTTPQVKLDDGTLRGYGWDVSSSYSSLRGDIFRTGFGHTGWTGTSIWCVPEENCFIIILTNRCHPDGSGNVSALRAKVANVVAASIIESDSEPNAQDE